MFKYKIYTIFTIFVALPAFSTSTNYSDLSKFNNKVDTLKKRFYEAPETEQLYGSFTIIDTSGLVVYYQKRKHFRYGEYKKYYYSISKTGRIYELNYENLYVDFKDNKKFLELMEKSKNSLSEIIDGITYVNYLLKKTL